MLWCHHIKHRDKFTFSYSCTKMQSFNAKWPNNTLTQHIKDNVTLQCVALSNVATETKVK